MKGSDINGQIMQKIMPINDQSKTTKYFQIKKSGASYYIVKRSTINNRTKVSMSSIF
jgi:hypothetical protein